VTQCRYFLNLFVDANYSTTLSLKKHHEHFRLSLENQLTDFDNFWYQYSEHNFPLNDRSVSHLTHCPLLHNLGKADQAKYTLK